MANVGRGIKKTIARASRVSILEKHLPITTTGPSWPRPQAQTPSSSAGTNRVSNAPPAILLRIEKAKKKTELAVTTFSTQTTTDIVDVQRSLYYEAHGNCLKAVRSLEATAAVCHQYSALGAKVVQHYAVMDLGDLAEDYQHHVLGKIRTTLPDPSSLVLLSDLWYHFKMEAYGMDTATRSNVHTRNQRLHTLRKRVERAKAHPDLYPVHSAFVLQLAKDSVTIEGWYMLLDVKRRRNEFAHSTVRAADGADIEKWNRAINGTEDTLRQLRNIVAAVAAEDLNPEARSE